MKLYTFGYIGQKIGLLEDWIKANDGYLLDIRYSPRSMAPQWRLNALAVRFGDRITWLQDWGNRNYNCEAGIEIVNFDDGLHFLRALSEAHKGPIVLMCGCRDAETCHRTVISVRLRSLGYEVEELNLCAV